MVRGTFANGRIHNRLASKEGSLSVHFPDGTEDTVFDTAMRYGDEGVPLVVIQRQLGHANLGITSIYLQGIDSSEIISTVHGRPSPTISANAGLRMRR